MFINWSQPIILCEGAFDAIAIKRNAIPLFGKIIQPVLQRKIIEKRVRDIYICLDADALRNVGCRRRGATDAATVSSPD